LPRFGRHKGGEYNQRIRFVQKIGSHFCHTFPYYNGVIIRLISNLYKNDVIFPENRFWLFLAFARYICQGITLSCQRQGSLGLG
jgi:hypothetical protein